MYRFSHNFAIYFLVVFLRGDSLVMVTNYRVNHLLLSHMSITKLKNTCNAKDCCHLVDVKAFFIKQKLVGLQISRKYQIFIVLEEKWRWQLNGDQKVSEIRVVLSFCLNVIFSLRPASIKADYWHFYFYKFWPTFQNTFRQFWNISRPNFDCFEIFSEYP